MRIRFSSILFAAILALANFPTLSAAAAPDLHIDSIVGVPTVFIAGLGNKVKVKVTNTSTVATPATKIEIFRRFYTGSPYYPINWALEGTKTLPALAPGASATITFNVWSVSTGPMNIPGVSIKVTLVPGETDYADNLMQKDFSVVPAPVAPTIAN
jgi:hypothetical protein